MKRTLLTGVSNIQCWVACSAVLGFVFFCLYALIKERKTFSPCLADKVYPLHETQTAKICFGFEKATQNSSVKRHVNVMCQRHCLFPWQQMEAYSIMKCRQKTENGAHKETSSLASVFYGLCLTSNNLVQREKWGYLNPYNHRSFPVGDWSHSVSCIMHSRTEREKHLFLT